MTLNKRAWIISALALLLALLLFFLFRPASVDSSDLLITIDQEPVALHTLLAPEQTGLRVALTHGEESLLDLPFGRPCQIRILQPGGAENILRLTETSVWMESANCTTQDCVHMGEITRENLDIRPMGGFIICLPHGLTVEVHST